MKPSAGSQKTPQLIPLPIDGLLPRIASAVQSSPVVLLAATPGSGKTTRVPWEISRALSGRVLVLEPRRLAAKLSAERVAEENGVEVGAREVGYHFRFEKKRGAETQLVFLTEGMLLKECLSNPTLDGVACVVLDEFHERHLQGDVSLAYLRAIQKSTRPDLKLVLMSATLELESLVQYFGQDCVRLEVEAPRFPIEIRHFEAERRANGKEERLEDRMSRIVLEALEAQDSADYGDLLVFLPGMADIRRLEEKLSARVSRDVDVLPLHGELTREEQDRAIRPSKRRKVILATNIAESSLTIPGVNTVIDSGLARVGMLAHWSGLPRLETKPISRASGIQRAGRAGRTGPGRVYRAYGKGDFEGRPFVDQAEIHRADLSGIFLELYELLEKQESTLGSLPWFEAPARERSASTEALLLRLGLAAEDIKPETKSGPGADGIKHFRVTELGKRALAIPLPLRLSRALLDGIERGVGEEMARAVVAISEEEDLGLDFLEGLKRYRVEGFTARKIYERLQPLLKGSKKSVATDEAIGRALLAGFPDRVGKKRGTDLVLSSGGSVALDVESMRAGALVSSHELFLALDVSESKHSAAQRGRMRVKSLVALELDWLMDLPNTAFSESHERVFDQARGRFMEVEEWRYGDLLLERTTREVSGEAGTKGERSGGADFGALWDAWRKNAAEVAPMPERERYQGALLRAKLACEVDPELFSGKSFEEFLKSTLESMFEGATRLSELPSFADAYETYLDPSVRARFEELAPEFISLPGRKKTPVIYQEGVPPRVESRMQDFFGLKVAPTILKGRKKLSLHLLAPNYRAVQVTEDLAGFWVRHYPTLRKELMRRYPRHKWPEDPLS